MFSSIDNIRGNLLKLKLVNLTNIKTPQRYLFRRGV